MAVFVSGHRVPQMRGIGLRAIHRVCEQADNKADVVPCDRLPRAGFTLLELLVILLVLGMLAALAAPAVNNSIGTAREAALKENLQVLRKAIDDYYADNGNYPPTLAALVTGRYVRRIPADPVTEAGDNPGWHVEYTENGEGIRDLRSSSTKTAGDGSRYDQW